MRYLHCCYRADSTALFQLFCSDSDNSCSFFRILSLPVLSHPIVTHPHCTVLYCTAASQDERFDSQAAHALLPRLLVTPFEQLLTMCTTGLSEGNRDLMAGLMADACFERLEHFVSQVLCVCRSTALQCATIYSTAHRLLCPCVSQLLFSLPSTHPDLIPLRWCLEVRRVRTRPERHLH